VFPYCVFCAAPPKTQASRGPDVVVFGLFVAFLAPDRGNCHWTADPGGLAPHQDAAEQKPFAPRKGPPAVARAIAAPGGPGGGRAYCPGRSAPALTRAWRSWASAIAIEAPMKTTTAQKMPRAWPLSISQPKITGPTAPPMLKPVETIPKTRPSAPRGDAAR